MNKYKVKGKGKVIPIQARRDPRVLRDLQTIGCEPYAPAAFTLQEIFLLRAEPTQGHKAAGKMRSIKNPNKPYRQSKPRPSRL